MEAHRGRVKGPHGVSWSKSKNRWRVKKRFGKNRIEEYFDEEDDAMRCCDRFIIKYEKPDAPTYFPRDQYEVEK